MTKKQKEHLKFLIEQIKLNRSMEDAVCMTIFGKSNEECFNNLIEALKKAVEEAN